MSEAETEIRDCLRKGAQAVQIDFTEARLSLKLDPSKQLLRSFIDLNNRVLDRFSPDERSRIGVRHGIGMHFRVHFSRIDTEHSHRRALIV